MWRPALGSGPPAVRVFLWWGLVEGQVDERDDVPFAVYVTNLADP